MMDRALDPRLASPGASGLVVPGALVASTGVATIAAASTGWQGMLLIAWLALACVAWWNPAAGLAVIAFAVPFEERLTIPTIAGDLSAMEFTVWAVALGVLPRLLRVRQVVVDRIATMHGAVVVALVASVAAGGVHLPSWGWTVHFWLIAWLVYVIARSLRLSIRERLAIVAVLATGLVINASLAIGQLVTGAGPESYQVGDAVRVFGTFLHPNTLASCIGVVLPMVLAVSLATPVRNAWLIRIGAVLGMVTLVLTQSRGGMLSVGAAVLVLFAIAPRRLQRQVAALAMGAALLLIVTGTIENLPGLDRFSNVAVGGETTQVTKETWGQREREAHWGAAWSMLRSDPLFGVGAGQFDDQFRAHTPEWRFRIGRGDAHNSYLQLGAEAGVPGLAAWVLWVGTIVASLWRRIRRVAGIEYWLAAGAFGSAFAWIVDTIFEHPSVSSIPVVFVLVVAIGLGGISVMEPSSPRDVTTGVAP